MKKFALTTVFALALTAPAMAEPACPVIQTDRTIVSVEVRDRRAAIQQVIDQNRLKGTFCVSRRGNLVWLSEGLEKGDDAVRVWDYFERAGLVKRVKLPR